MKKFTFEFTEEQINYIINVLGTRPYGEVKPLVDYIQEQGASQLQPEMEVVDSEK